MKRIWKCEACDTTAEMSYDDLVDVGMPICDKCDAEMEITKEEIKEKVQISVHIMGGVCYDVLVNLPDDEWEYAIVDHDDDPDLPDDHNPFKD